MTQVIYKIINLVNDKFYVGSTTNKKVRFRQHRKLLRGGRHHCKHLQASWNKYGESKFDFVVVEEVPETMSLQQVEEIYLMQHVGKPYCYNTGRSADAPWRGVYGAAHPAFGKPISNKHKEAISTTLKEFYAEDYYNHPRVGKKHTPETIAKIRVKKHVPKGDEHYRYGQTLTEDVRKKIGDTQRGKPKAKGRKVSAEGMVKIRAAAEAGHYDHWKGRKHTEEAKQKMSKRVFEITNNQEFPSLTAVLQHYEMTMPTLRRALVSGEPISKGKFAGLWFKYLGITVDTH